MALGGPDLALLAMVSTMFFLIPNDFGMVGEFTGMAELT